MALELDMNERTARGVWMAAQAEGNLPADVLESIWGEAVGAISTYTAWQLAIMGEMSVRWCPETRRCTFRTIDDPAEIRRRKDAIRRAMDWRAPE